MCVVPGCEKPHKAHGFCMDHRDIVRSYGIDPREFEKQVDGQNGVCAICGQTCALYSRLSVDHDHVTHALRGLLCARCNVGLGRFRESADLLRKAAEYLERGGVWVAAQSVVRPRVKKKRQDQSPDIEAA